MGKEKLLSFGPRCRYRGWAHGRMDGTWRERGDQMCGAAAASRSEFRAHLLLFSSYLPQNKRKSGKRGFNFLLKRKNFNLQRIRSVVCCRIQKLFS
jgi:hypothetical protein